MRFKQVKNVAAGRKAKVIGAQVEALIERELYRQGALVIPIPSGCKWLGPNRVTPVQTPFDGLAIKDNVPVFFDIKSTSQTNFSYSQITSHQVHWLSLIEAKGLKAGYIVHFQKTDDVVFFKASDLDKLRPKESLSKEKGQDLKALKTLDFSHLFLPF